MCPGAEEVDLNKGERIPEPIDEPDEELAWRELRALVRLPSIV